MQCLAKTSNREGDDSKQIVIELCNDLRHLIDDVRYFTSTPKQNFEGKKGDLISTLLNSSMKDIYVHEHL